MDDPKEKSRRFSFAERLRRVALFYGIPLLFLDLIESQHKDLLTALLLLPFVILGVLLYTVIEHGMVKFLKDDRNRPS